MAAVGRVYTSPAAAGERFCGGEVGWTAQNEDYGRRNLARKACFFSSRRPRCF